VNCSLNLTFLEFVHTGLSIASSREASRQKEQEKEEGEGN